MLLRGICHFCVKTAILSQLIHQEHGMETSLQRQICRPVLKLQFYDPFNHLFHTLIIRIQHIRIDYFLQSWCQEVFNNRGKRNVIKCESLFQLNSLFKMTSWASYQIRKIAGCACAGNAGNVFPATDFKGNRLLAIPACITARASRTCCDGCRGR